MPRNNYEQYVKHLSSIIESFDRNVQNEGSFSNSPDGLAHGILVRSQNAIQHICGNESPYTEKIKEIIDSPWDLSYRVELVIGVVRALASDLAGGYLESISELARGNLFEDYLEMAYHLSNEGYKDAAAVIAGSSLEAHLRQLCHKKNVAVASIGSDGSIRHKKAEQLNQELGKVAYSLFDQKQITAWLDLRNSAAHGQYSNYSDKQVAQFIEWVRDFISKNPA